LWEIKDNDEKDSAFRGFCMLIQANPAGIQKDYLWFCNAVCKWQRPSPELNDMFQKVSTCKMCHVFIHINGDCF
jgi:transportin-1